MDQRLKTAHDHVVRTQHGDPGGEEHDSGHHRQQAPEYA